VIRKVNVVNPFIQKFKQYYIYDEMFRGEHQRFLEWYNLDLETYLAAFSPKRPLQLW
jgi:hypothetical protein